jgi:hypothetical protein
MISDCNLEKAREQDPSPISLFGGIDISTTAESWGWDSAGTASIPENQRWDM